MSIFKRKAKLEKRDDNVGFRPDDPAADLARAFGVETTEIDLDKAMQLPPISASIDFISSICARVPIKLYRETSDKEGNHTEEVSKDRRIELLNGSTGDSLNAYQMKKAWVTDYFGHGQGYIYIDKMWSGWRSLRYVEQKNISINISTDPIFKDADIFIADRRYYYWDFLRLCRNTSNGFEGKSIIDTNGELLALMYDTMKFEKMLMDTGGNKKGFLKAANKLTDKAMQDIKRAWRELYSRRSNNVMVLNNGLDYKETSATSTEMQLNENKLTNNDALTMIFLLSAKALQGASDDDIVSAVKTAVIPIIEQMEQAFNEGMLLEDEKNSMYWACDTSALERGDILKRFQAYKLAIEGNFMQADEIRYKEDMPALGLNWIRLGLDDVLYDPKSKTIYTPNTNASVKVGEGGIAVSDELRYNENHDPHNGQFTSGDGGAAGSESSTQKSDEKSSKSVDKSAKDDIIRKEFDEAEKSGKISTKVNKKQEAHKYGSNAYNERIAKGEHPSYTKLSKMEIQQVINRNIETAELRKQPDGQFLAVFRDEKFTGYFVDDETFIATETHRGTIHFSKDGAHIVPAYPKE
ncbi:MAG: phage portal protein [Ruminococcus sp.]|nr:phage portal protein [Ruminococcus sp.]